MEKVMNGSSQGQTEQSSDTIDFESQLYLPLTLSLLLARRPRATYLTL